jgi:hypothetical protein
MARNGVAAPPIRTPTEVDRPAMIAAILSAVTNAVKLVDTLALSSVHVGVFESAHVRHAAKELCARFTVKELAIPVQPTLLSNSKAARAMLDSLCIAALGFCELSEGLPESDRILAFETNCLQGVVCRDTYTPFLRSWDASNVFSDALIGCRLAIAAIDSHVGRPPIKTPAAAEVAADVRHRRSVPRSDSPLKDVSAPASEDEDEDEEEAEEGDDEDM